jgi:hypothetical protein
MSSPNQPQRRTGKPTQYVDKMGNLSPYFFDQNKQPCDEQGRPLEIVGMHLGPRTKADYPYSYDAVLQWKKFDRTPQDGHVVYSDRLAQWDYDKYRRLCLEHFRQGNDPGGDYFYLRSPQKIEQFLRDYYGNPELELLRVEEHCNVGNGFPVWVFFFRDKAPAPTKAG